MEAFDSVTIATAIAFSICLTGAIVHADEPAQSIPAVQRHPLPRIPNHAPPALPAPEPTDTAASSSGFATTRALTSTSQSVSPQATTLSPPITLTYSGSSNALTVTDSGTGRGISSSVTNTGSGSSALYGSTVGSGAGLTGFNGGTGGPGGKFQVTNSQSAQAGAFASTNGTGPAILGTVTNPNSSYPAIYGQNTTSGGAGAGIGVEGYGSNMGVYGADSGDGGYGVYGYSSSGEGIYGESTTTTGVYAALDNGLPGGEALFAADHSPANAGSYGIYAASDANTTAYFVGGSAGGGYCSFSGGTGWNCSSDKNLKKDFVPVDGTALLEHLAALPVFEYSMKGEHTATRYVGPTAQDFMNAFHLGDNDTLINTANAQGVVLAAAKELYEKVKQDETKINQDEVMIRQSAIEIANLKRDLAAQTEIQRKDAEISELKAHLAQQTGTVTALQQQFAELLAAMTDMKAERKVASR